MKGNNLSALEIRSLVICRLSEGYGVEDIAVMDQVKINLVRAVVRRLKADGYLEAICHGGTDAWLSAKGVRG